MFITGDMCMDIKCFVWLSSASTLSKVRPAGPLFPIHTNAVCMCPVEPGNETGFADWPEEDKLDSF